SKGAHHHMGMRGVARDHPVVVVVPHAESGLRNAAVGRRHARKLEKAGMAVMLIRCVRIGIVVRRGDGTRGRGARLVGTDATVAVCTAADACAHRLGLVKVSHWSSSTRSPSRSPGTLSTACAALSYFS